LSLITRLRPPPAPEPTSLDDEVAADPGRDDRPRHRILSGTLTAAAGLLVFVALVVPDQLARFKPGAFVPGAFLRIPLEGILGAAILIALPTRARRVVATLLGLGLGALTILKILNMGFLTVLGRRFDPVLDWPLLGDGYNAVTAMYGRPAATGAAIGAAVLGLAVLAVLALSVRRVAGFAARHHRPATATVTALVAAWAAFAMIGTQLFPGAPVASDTTASMAKKAVLKVPASLRDQKEFAAALRTDPYRDVPANELLAGLRGKDIVFGVVESYGRSALEDPQMGALVKPALAADAQQLAAAGFSARSAFLTSSTYGGGSWLAHGSFQSGLWVDNPQRYRQLVKSDRLTLASAFSRAGWQTVGVEPGNTTDWGEEGDFYGYDQVYDARNLGYRGPRFGWSSMPDQFTLAAFQRNVYGKAKHSPMMAEITLTSSHEPWAPIPKLVDWNAVGDGSVYGPIAAHGKKQSTVWKDPARIRAEYAKSIAYSVDSLVSWAATYGDRNLVLVFFGDHQAASMVSGQDASHDVPVTIVARDPAVLDRISGWGWQEGVSPDPHAPVWGMDSFRDKFLDAFGSRPDPSRSTH
jgi:hypothetical protein